MAATARWGAPRAGFAGYFLKPVKLDGLVAAVTALSHRGQARQSPPPFPDVLLVALTVHRQAVMTDDLVVALDDGIAEVAALFGHRL